MNTANTAIVNIYKNLDPSKIDSYGSHISIAQGLRGRISSLLHWNLGYDQRNFTQYRVEWAQANSEKNFEQNSTINQELVDALNAIRTLKNFDEFNSREVAQLILAFKNKAYADCISSIISEYSTLHIDINVYIQSILNQRNFKIDDLQTIINRLKKDTTDSAAQSVIQTTWDLIKSALKENLIFETMCSLTAYQYALFPILDTTLHALSHSMFFTYFWTYLFSGIVATLSITLIGGLLPGGIQGLQSEWKKAVSDDNSFHPIVDAIIGGLYIAGSWLFIDKLETSAQIGSLFYTLGQYGIKNYVLKYLTMNLFFTMKAQMHQGSIDISSLTQNALGGVIRGLLKNPMINSMNHFFTENIKLELASSLQTYTPFLADTYLKEWWINQVVAQNILGSTPLCLLKDSPTKLISAFWLTAEIVTICITNFSKVLEIVAIAIVWPVIQKAYDYRTISLALIAILVMYQKAQLFTELLFY